MGEIVGAFIGMVLIGGLAGWGIHKIFKQDWRLADPIGLLVIAIAGGFVNGSQPNHSVPYTLALFLIASIPAYFVLRRWRARRPRPQ